MSQQTRLEVVVPRFLEWMERFPTPQHLARASQDEVVAAWAGLGYYSRARNLHKCAQAIHRGGWPSSMEGLLALPGLGPYTAAAIGSLCLGLPVPMVDGNVQRVLSRYHALGGDPRGGAGAKRMREVAMEWIEGGDAGEINEATMELGALVCKPRNPRCGDCPLGDSCRACSSGNPEDFPPPRAKREVVEVRRTALVVEREGRILLRQAGGSELLSGLWILPALGDHPSLEAGELRGVVRHSITHHKVVWEVRSGGWTGGEQPPQWCWRSREELGEVVVSSLLRKALERANILATQPRPRSPRS